VGYRAGEEAKAIRFGQRAALQDHRRETQEPRVLR
jgi:hypothetical protein